MGMAKRKFQFSLSALIIATIVAAAIFALCFQVPAGQFAFEGRVRSNRPIKPGEAVVRLLVVAPLVAIETAGILLIFNFRNKMRDKRR
jgi:hypothetical protein